MMRTAFVLSAGIGKIKPVLEQEGYGGRLSMMEGSHLAGRMSGPNRQLVAGAQPFKVFTAAIEEELKRISFPRRP